MIFKAVHTTVVLQHKAFKLYERFPKALTHRRVDDLSKDRAIGLIILLGSTSGIVAYGLAMWSHPIIILQITAFLIASAILAILAWIDYTLSTTPPPKPIEESAPMAEEKAKEVKP